MNFSYKFITWSIIISILIAILVYNLFPFYEFKGVEKALDGILLLSSISLGFYGASLSVLASIINTSVIKNIMNDNEERKELLIISSLTLLVGFFTIIITIIYQVMYSNEINYLDIINAIWFFTISLFFSMKILYILVIFLILFNNKDNDESGTDVYSPKLLNNN